MAMRKKGGGGSGILFIEKSGQLRLADKSVEQELLESRASSA